MQNNGETDNQINIAGTFLGQFENLEKIGSGTTGIVYKAWDKKMERAVALKVLSSEQATEKNVVRLHREAKTICQLKHANIVDIYDFVVTEHSEPVMVMELVEGLSLEKYIAEQGCLSIKDGLSIVSQVASAMIYAHARGILHRDLTAGNVLLKSIAKDNFRIKVVDFGIARVEGSQSSTLKQTGGLIGSATVISPEQSRGEAIDGRSDLYSLGCLAFKVLTGSYPFTGDTFLEVVYKQINEKAPTLSAVNPSGNYSPELEQVIAKSIAKRPGDRYQDMGEFKEAIEGILTALPLNVPPTADDLDEEEPLFGKNANENTAILPTSSITKSSYAVIAWVVLFLVSLIIIPITFFKSHGEEKQSVLYRFQKNDQNWITPLKGRFALPVDEQIDLMIKELKEQPDIRRVQLSQVRVKKEQLIELCSFPLVILDLRGTNVNDDWMEIISRCSSLRTLLLARTRVSDKGVEQLASLKNLQILDLDDTRVTDEGVHFITEQNKGFRGLHFGDCKNVTDKSLDAILSLKDLDSLNVGGSGLSAQAVRKLFESNQLGFIGISSLKLNDSDLPDLKDNHVTRMDLAGNNFTSAILPNISQVKNLCFVDLRNCKGISDYVAKDFGEQHRDANIVPNSFYLDSDDTEGYYEPTLYDLCGRDQALIKQKLMDWFGQVHLSSDS